MWKDLRTNIKATLLNSRDKFGCDAKVIYSLWANLSFPLPDIPSRSFTLENSPVTGEARVRAAAPEPVPSLETDRAVKYRTDSAEQRRP